MWRPAVVGVVAALVSLWVPPSLQFQPVMHPAFKDAGRRDGIQIWRIEKFEPVPVPQAEYGKFYSGDSYILLSSREDKKNKGTFTWDIHYWLGEKTSQDESGAAAILSVELDDQLGGSPVQHREVQDHESPQFLSYFKAGVRYMPGGVASGFNHIVTNDPGERKLYQVKGKKNVRVRQVELNVKSMNKGDCFILDAGNEIFVYVGPNARGTERLKAISAANNIRDQDHSGRAKVSIIDASSTQTEINDFFSKLGSGSPDQVPEERSGGVDDEFEKNLDTSVSLYKVSDADGKIKADKINQTPLKQDMLKTDDCFILDTINSGIFVWIGKKSTTQEKVESLKRGEAFLVSKNYPKWTKMVRVVEGAEPTAFKEYFSGWRDSQFIGGVGRRTRREIRIGTRPGFMPDSGNGTVEVSMYWDNSVEIIPSDQFGIFYSKMTYLIRYRSKDVKICYLWQGADGSNFYKPFTYHNTFLQDVREGFDFILFNQGEEPAHFLKIFKGKLLILKGDPETNTPNSREVRMLQIIGVSKDNIRAIEVTPEGSSLNTNDTFLIYQKDESFIWIGQGSSGNEVTAADWVLEKMGGSEVTMVNEGKEPLAMWTALGGRVDYTQQPEELAETLPESKLYHCYTDSKGRLHCDILFTRSQQDLNVDDVMVLVTEDEVYIWVGEDATPEEKMLTFEHFQSVLRRRTRMPIVSTVRQGKEPLRFINQFQDWNYSYWENLKSYEELKNEIGDFNKNMKL